MTIPSTIYILQSAHTDIGYTHPQEQIQLMYLDHYDRVLELCRASEQRPEAVRFKWTCETAWQVQHYLRHRPEREQEFLAFVRNGQIEITATYLHFTDLIDADAYRRSLAWVVEYCREHHLPLRCALHCDINGWPWAVADVLAEYNIPYFCSQVHIDSGTDPLGRRGSVHYGWVLELGDRLKPDTPVRIPQAFYWQGPQQGRVLHWLNEHYLLGNMLGISSPYPFHADKTRYFLENDRLTVDNLYQMASREVPRYLQRLHADAYPYDIALLSTGGFFVDNAPPDHRWCEVIERWNAEHPDVQMRTATLSEWFTALEHQPLSLPTYQVAWPDHWAHGLGSQTALIAQARRNQRRRAAIAALVEQVHTSSASQLLATALEQERLALEHTWNAWSTSSQPSSPLVDHQTAAKALTFHRADLYFDEAAGAALRTITQPGSSSALWLYSSIDATRVVHFDAGDMHLDPATQVLVGDDGVPVPFQRDRDDLAQFVAVVTPGSPGLSRWRVAPQPSALAAASDAGLTLSSAAWQLQVDPLTGGLRSMRDATTDREWVDTAHQYAFGQLVHEAVIHPLGREAVHNTARFVALDVAADQLREALGEHETFAHTTLTLERQWLRHHGQVFDSVVMDGTASRIGRAQLQWRLYHHLPLVELVIDWQKVWSDVPEAAYVAFPFAAQGGRIELETGGGFFQPGSHDAGGQLPGTCSSYYTIQRAARITTPDAQRLLWLPVDAPLVMTNELNYNRWETVPYQWNGFLASMPVNHYWHTNFVVSQRGHLRLRYRFCTPDTMVDDTAIQQALPLDAIGWR